MSLLDEDTLVGFGKFTHSSCSVHIGCIPLLYTDTNTTNHNKSAPFPKRTNPPGIILRSLRCFLQSFFPFTIHVPTTTHQNKNNRAERDQTEPRRKEATGEGERGGREPRLHLIFLPTDHLSFFSTQDNESSNRASERGFGGATPIFHRGRHRRQRTPTHAYILVFSFPFHVFSPSFSPVLGFGVTLQRERQIKRGVFSFSFLFWFRFRL